MAEEQSSTTPAVWPETLTPALTDILGRICFTVIPIVEAYRAVGFDIPRRAEDEQAFVAHRSLKFWFLHGDNWLEAAQADLDALLTAAEAKAAEEQKP